MPANKDSERATIYDVAERAGVAISTVSRVLNNSRDVSDTTRENVLRAIRALQFRPNRTAKSLAQQAAQTVAVAVPTFTTPFHNELLKGVRTEIGTTEIDLLLCDLAWSAPKATLSNFLSRGAMDGLLLTGLEIDEEISQELYTLGAPVVLVGNHWPELDSFYWDETPGARLAVEHLIEQGHERIGMISTHMESGLRDSRIEGYRQALEGAGIAYNPDLIAEGTIDKHAGFSEEAGYEAMQQILKLDPPVTAVFASSDVQAIGAWQAIRETGQRIPDDVALIGYDDIKISQFIGLSSVAQNMHDVGADATRLLLQRMSRTADEEIVSKLVMPELKVRKSSVK